LISLLEAEPIVKNTKDRRRASLLHAAPAHLLRDLGPAAKAAVPTIRKVLRGGIYDTGFEYEICQTLAAIGPAAKEATPEIEPLLKSSNPDVRVHSAEALWKVTGEVDAALPVLRAELTRDPRYGARALAAVLIIERMGTAAKDAIPDLRRLVESGGQSDAQLRNDALRALRAVESDAKR
jgi:hypothetical protein